MNLTLFIYILFAVPASLIDLKTLRIPDLLTFPCIAALIAATALFDGPFLPEALCMGAASFLFFFSLRKFTGGLGFGDVKFSALTGLLCGFQGTFLAFLLASALGLLVAATLALFRTLTRETKIPFAPFIALGTIGAKLLAAYSPAFFAFP